MFVTLCRTHFSVCLDWIDESWTQVFRCVSWGMSRGGGLPPSINLSNRLCKAAQEAVGFICHEGSFPGHGQPGVHQDLQGLSCQAAFQMVGSQHVPLHRVNPPQEQDFPLSFLRETPVSPILQPVKDPLNSSTHISSISHSCSFVSSAYLLKVLSHHPDHQWRCETV